MDASDMGLPDDELLKRLQTLAERGFDFEDLLAAELDRQGKMDELAEVIDKHDRGPLKGVKLPRAQFGAEDIPDLVDSLIQAGFHHPGASASLAIRLTNTVRGFQSTEAKSKLKELLSAMAEAEDGDLTIQLVMDTCKRELD
jgi:hypothetical protein